MYIVTFDFPFPQSFASIVEEKKLANSKVDLKRLVGNSKKPATIEEAINRGIASINERGLHY